MRYVTTMRKRGRMKIEHSTFKIQVRGLRDANKLFLAFCFIDPELVHSII